VLWEFHAVVGLTRDELRREHASWPAAGAWTESQQLAAVNSIVSLLGFTPSPVDDEAWPSYVRVSKDVLRALLPRVRHAAGLGPSRRTGSVLFDNMT